MRDTSFAKCFSLSFSLHLLWKRTRSSDHSPLWIKCSRHPDSETTQHAHIAPTVQQSFPATLCPRDQEKQSKAHTNRCNTSFVVTKQTRAPGDSRRVNNVRHFVTHAHAPATFVRAAQSLAHGAPTLEESEKRTTRRVATVAGVEKQKQRKKSFSSNSFRLDRARGAKSGGSQAAADARGASASAVSHFASARPGSRRI